MSNWPTEKLKLLAEACAWPVFTSMEWFDHIQPTPSVVVYDDGAMFLEMERGQENMIPFSPTADNGELLLAMLQSEGWKDEWMLSKCGPNLWWVKQGLTWAGDVADTPTEAVAEAILAARREED